MQHWQNKIVVVTGGSEGLGREIAFEFSRCGATVVILARHEDRLLATIEEGTTQGLSISSVVADVTNDASVHQAINQILERFNRIDVWINNVGKSTRTQLTDCDVEQYRQYMELNFYSAVRCSLAALPHLEKTSGHLVQIGSLSCKTGWPLMAPYSTSKHALAAFNHQLRIEGPSNISTLLVCPGPIKRLDAATRYDAQTAGLGTGVSESARQPGGGVKMKGIPPRLLAEKIERAVRQRKIELVVPSYPRFLFALAQLVPRWADWLLLRGKK